MERIVQFNLFHRAGNSVEDRKTTACSQVLPVVLDLRHCLPKYLSTDPGPSDEDDDMVSSNLVMSDRRVPRRCALGNGRSVAPIIFKPQFTRSGIGCATRLMQEGAAFCMSEPKAER
jgi:hypothetical protein